MTILSPWLGWEGVAVLASLAYVYFAAQKSIWCWPAAFISTAIYTVLFFEVSLLMDSTLQVYYLIMAIYGWYHWRKASKSQNSTDKKEMPIRTWGWKNHFVALAVLALISLGLGHFMATSTHADFAYIDSATTVFAVFGTWLVAQRILEHWIYWIVIDLISIYIYIEKGLYPTAVLFVLMTLMACWGYMKWLKTMPPASRPASVH